MIHWCRHQKQAVLSNKEATMGHRCNIDATLINSVQTLMIIDVFNAFISETSMFHWCFLDDSVDDSLKNYRCTIHWETNLCKVTNTCKPGYFISRPQVKSPHTQFTRITCNLRVKTVKITASTWQRPHAEAMQKRPNMKSKVASDW